MTSEELHQYLKTKKIDVSKKVRKEVFNFSPEEMVTANAAVTKLEEGYR